MKSLILKILKIIFKVLGILLMISLLFILGIWIKYTSIVTPVPDNGNRFFQPGKYGKFVNNFIGTGGFPAWVCGMNFPGATVPFGMVRLSPETISLFPDGNLLIPQKKALNTSGYYYGDNRILGFSHTRLAGTGATDGGHFLFTPTTKNLSKIDLNKDLYHHFSHADETAFPGYYSVNLKKEAIYAELTTTKRTGLHRYTFPKNSPKNILIKITNSTGNKRVENGKVTILPHINTVEGSVRTFGTFGGRYGGQEIFFSARFDMDFSSYGIWNGKEYTENQQSGSGDQLIAVISFNKPIVIVKIGISYVSIENARLNLEKEAVGRSFEEIVEQAKQSWEQKLSLIKIKGGTNEDQKIFYSALYRSFQMPTTFNDVNGDYKGFDDKIHKEKGYRYYTDFSLWDTFRTIHPLFNLIARDEQRDMMISLVKMAKQGGSLPRWPSGNGYTGSMLGSPADMVITEAYLKGITDFDVEYAFKKMKETATNPVKKGSKASGRRSIKSYLKYGYCPNELEDKSVAKTLEYSWADYSICLLAGKLGHKDDSIFFRNQSMNYKNVWNPETQFFQSRKIDGSFVEKFDPLQLTYTDWDEEYTKAYVEGSALQWRWAVPFDAKGLISLFKSKEYFINELNDFFALSKAKPATWIPDNYYWHGNEPDIHAVYLFNDAGRPDLTQKWVRWILKNKYENDDVGIDGNDDAGTLSAWYIFSSLGIYPIAGTDIYELGIPLFKDAEINMGNHTLKIITENYSKKNTFVKEVYLNNKLLSKRQIRHAEIAKGGTLKFILDKSNLSEK